MSLLDELIKDLDKNLLDLPSVYTNLDEKMYRLRYDDMVSCRNFALGLVFLSVLRV